MGIAGWIVSVIVVTFWVSGWLVMYSATSVSQEPKLMKRIGGLVLLFFVWWYIAACMARQGDI